jgi:hypothetical protein
MGEVLAALAQEGKRRAEHPDQDHRNRKLVKLAVTIAALSLVKVADVAIRERYYG